MKLFAPATLPLFVEAPLLILLTSLGFVLVGYEFSAGGRA